MKLKVYRFMGMWQVGEPNKIGIPFSVQYSTWIEAVKFANLCFVRPEIWRDWSDAR